MASKANINPALLRWAREQAGLTQIEAAEKANIGGTRERTPAERLDDFERGRERPSLVQFKALAKTYRRPLITFYLTSPAASDSAIPDFRTLADRPIGEQGLLLGTLLRRVRARQQEVREILLEDEESRRRLSFVGKFSTDVDFAEVLSDIRDTLSISPGTQKAARDQDDFFRLLRRNTETAGIFVQLAGDLGSWHTAIAPEEFRGFALIDDVAPFVLINANDAKAAYPFTLLHEIAHIWLGEGGISNVSPFDAIDDTRRIERICNRIAAEFLVPQQMIAREWNAISRTNVPQAIAALARDWKVSRAVVARRLKDLGEISEETWRGLYSTYQEEWRHRAQRLRDQEGGPSYYVTTRSRLGNSLINTVLGAVDAGTVTYTRASRILGINAKAFDGLRAAR